MYLNGLKPGVLELEPILTDWRQFCEDMGSRPVTVAERTAHLNDSAPFACDYANCIVGFVPPEEIPTIRWGMKELGIPRLAVYSVGPLWPKPHAGSRLSFGMVYVWEDDPPPMPAEMRVWGVTEQDVPEFVDLVFDAFGYDAALKPATLTAYRFGLRSGRVGLVGGLVGGDRLVSGLLVHGGHEASAIEFVSTLPAHQGKGYGTALVAETVRRLRRDGVKVIWLWANADSPAVRLYEHLGFERRFNVRTYRL
jgi:GNAT superfamily N-acetyltransferase